MTQALLRVARRLLWAIPLTCAVSAAVFLLLELGPGDPAQILTDPIGSNEVNETQRRILGLDKPAPERFLRWMGATLTLDFGRSFADGRPVREKILEVLPNTVALSGVSLLTGFALGVGIALLCARRPRGWLDAGLSAASLFVTSVPIFWLSFIAVAWFSVRLGWFPSGGALSVQARGEPGLHVLDRLHHLTLPAAILALYIGAHVARYTRASLVDTLRLEFIRAARARGAGEARVLWTHALPSSLHTTIALFGLSIPFLVAGTVLVEWVFDWPGMGQLLVGALKRRDYPVACAGVVVVSLASIAGNLAAEELAKVLDPRA